MKRGLYALPRAGTSSLAGSTRDCHVHTLLLQPWVVGSVQVQWFGGPRVAVVRFIEQVTRSAEDAGRVDAAANASLEGWDRVAPGGVRRVSGDYRRTGDL